MTDHTTDSPTGGETLEMEVRTYSAYYYALRGTGCAPVDRIAEAVARAGKLLHNTSDWSEEFYGEPTCVALIQAALDEAAAGVQRLTAERDAAVAWIGAVRDELVTAGYPGGDRTVALANIRALIAGAARLEEALRGVGYSDPDVPGGVCWCAVDDAYPDEHDAECLAARRALNHEGGDHAG